MSSFAHPTSYLYLQQDHEKAELRALGTTEAAVFSRRSPGKETPNEDAALVIAIDVDTAVLAVADGCGGMSGGGQASGLTIEAVAEVIAETGGRSETLRAAILDGMEKANATVAALGTGAATTLAVVELSQGKIRPYHVGDSQVLLVGNHGKVKLQTRSHAPVAYAVEAGMLSEEEAIHHEDRHLVSNVIGSEDTHIEIGPRRKISARDTLLIASDGVFDNLHLEEIVELIRKGPLATAARRLVEKTLERMQGGSEDHPSKPDDVTFILLRLKR